MKILDLTAGNRATWFNKKHPMAIYIDKRPEVNPDFVCDIAHIPPDAGSDFDLIVFDPPHENCGSSSNMSRCYGHSTRAEIIETINCASVEAHRLTRPDALMALKWNDTAFNLDKVLYILKGCWEPLFGHHMRNRGGHGAKTQTYWVMLRRLEYSILDF